MQLLPELGRLADVRVVVDDRLAGTVTPPRHVTVVSLEDCEAEADQSDLAIYHMGNNYALHGRIYEELLRSPGLVILHDPSLADFYGGLHVPSGKGFAEEVRFNYGSLLLEPPRLQIGPTSHLDRLALQLSRRVVEASLGVVVHSRWARDELTRRFPHKLIFEMPLAAKIASQGAGQLAIRHRLGWGENDVVFGVLGGLWPHKRLDLVVEIFTALQPLRPNARLLIAGRLEDREAVARVQAAVAEAGLDSAVGVLTDIDDHDFDACLIASDVLVDLRWPTAGEIPATLMRAFGAGRPVVATDLPQLRAYDSRFCWRVPVERAVAAQAALEKMLLLAREPWRARAAGRAARGFVEEFATPAHCARRYCEIAWEVLATREPGTRVRTTAGTGGGLDGALSLNVIGDFEATTGLMEAGRRAVQALAGAGVGVQLTAFDSQAPRSATRHLGELDILPSGRSAQVDLWLANINEFHLISPEELRPSDRSSYTIASWFWEAPRLPAFCDSQLSRVDEIWAPSHFVAATFARLCSKPVRVMPCVVDVPLPPMSSRADFGLPDDAMLVFYSFDANSTDARKNPWGLIEAFARAFDVSERSGPVRLVMKAQNLHDKRFRRPLQEALDEVGGLLMEGEFTREEMNGLLGAIDVYASLHRAEGFGLGLAEAMFLGKPVIGTAYSGNVDFMTPANSCLVGYSLRPVDDADHRWRPEAALLYEPGLVWAEPRLDQAARWMRLLYKRPEERARLGAAAAKTIRSYCSPAAVGAMMVERLREIQERVLIGGGTAA